MDAKRRKQFIREDEPEKGLEITMPDSSEFFGALNEALNKLTS